MNSRSASRSIHPARVPSRAALALLVCTGVPVALAAPNLAGVTVCLGTSTGVMHGGTSGRNATLTNRVLAEVRTAFRSGGVTFREASNCASSDAAFTLTLDVGPRGTDGRVATRVAGDVTDWTKGSKWTGGALRWSAVQFGSAADTDADLSVRLLTDARAVLKVFVNDWKAARP